MENNLILAIVINLVVIFYLFNFYTRNRKVIGKIKFGNILFFGSSLLVLILGTLIIFNTLREGFILLLLPLLLMSLWFSYYFYRNKNSLLDYIYLIIVFIVSVIILYELK